MPPNTPYLNLPIVPFAGRARQDYNTWLELEQHLQSIHTTLDGWSQATNSRLGAVEIASGTISSRYVDARLYGVVADGNKLNHLSGTDNFSAINAALAAAKTASLPLVFPPGVIRSLHTGSNFQHAIDWDGAEILGAGRKRTTFMVSVKDPLNDPYRFFKLAAGNNIYLHDFDVIGPATLGLDDFNPPPEQTTFYVEDFVRGPHFDILIERVNQSGSRGGLQTQAQDNWSTITIKECDWTATTICVGYFASLDSVNKRLIVDNCYFHDTHHLSGSHCIYLGVPVSCQITNTRFDNIPGAKYAIQNWESSNVWPNHMLIDNCWFGPGISIGVLTNEHGPVQISNSTFECLLGIELRNSATVVGCLFRPSSYVSGAYIHSSTSQMISSYADWAYDSHVAIVACGFDWANHLSSEAVGITSYFPGNWTIAACTFTANNGSQANGSIPANCLGGSCIDVQGLSSGVTMRISDCIATFATGSGNITRFVKVFPSDTTTGRGGSVIVDNCSFTGRVASDHGAVTVIGTNAPDYIEVRNSSFLTTGGSPLLTVGTTTPGTVRGENNYFYSSPSINANADCDLKPKRAFERAVVQSSSSVSLSQNADTFTVAGSASIDWMLIGGSAASQRAFHGTIVRVVASGSFSTTAAGNFIPKTTGSRPVDSVMSFLYDATAAKWREI